MYTTNGREGSAMRACLLVLFYGLAVSACGAAEGTEPGHCTDGADNDGDGDFDCADDGCRGAPFCVRAREAAAEAAREANGETTAAAAVSPPGNEPSAAVPAQPEPSAPEPAQPLTAQPSSGEAAAGALLAYRRLLTAYRDGDRDGYSRGYAETLRCFHGRDQYPRSALERARRAALASNAAATPGRLPVHHARSLEMRVMAATEDEVELVDYGWTGTGASDASVVFHQKWVVLARQGGRWRVIIEAPANRATCGLPAVRETPPPLWTHMRDWLRGLVAECEGPSGSTAEDGYPGLGGSIGCDPTSSVPDPRAICAGADTAHRRACMGRARAELALFVYGRADAAL